MTIQNVDAPTETCSECEKAMIFHGEETPDNGDPIRTYSCFTPGCKNKGKLLVRKI